MKYRAIYADPPWAYNTWNAEGVPTRKLVARGMAPAHYPVMKLDEIAALPVKDLADKDCCLFLWATWPRLEWALAVGQAWGFRYVTDAFLWTKLTPNSGNSFMPKYHFGLGYWTRANTEPCLLFTKGNPKRLNNDVAQLIVSPVGRHSAKPLETYERIERLVEGPYLELFARKRERAGWHYWGNEVDSDIQLAV